MMVATAARVEYVGGKASAHATSAAGAASGEARANTICYCLSPFYKKNLACGGASRNVAPPVGAAWRGGAVRRPVLRRCGGCEWTLPRRTCLTSGEECSAWLARSVDERRP
jgi:hypothetical protein